jgi:prevent-host-death family protein
MEKVGIRELKQNASAVVSRAEHGETIEITVQGRPVAKLIPMDTPGPKRWVSGAVLNGAFAGPAPDATGWYDEWYGSRGDDPIVDPWEPRTP